MEPKEHDFPVGQLIVDKKGIQVAVKGGTIHLMEVQLPGKRKMPVRDILNGVKFMETAYVR
jgi:methionyl-tRNA formyltransferase